MRLAHVTPGNPSRAGAVPAAAALVAGADALYTDVRRAYRLR
jgi:hypothetical protein